MLMNRRRLQLNHLKKRMVIVLSTLLVLSSLVPLPVSVKAETTQFSEVIVDGDKYPLTTDGLKTAITDTETNGKIYINGDIPITEMITISKSITIDGNAVSTLKRDSAYKGQLIKIDDNTTAKIERLIIDGANISSVGELINISTLTSSLLVGAKTSLIHNMNSAIINAGTLTFNGGYITKNSSINGAIANLSGATITMNGGEISENVNTGTGSAGIVNKGTLTINGGTFSKNITEGNGGAIYNDGTLNISNGQIISNQAKIGGGVYNNNYKSFNFSGGNIEANNATEKGGGVYQEGSGFTISKTASVVRNVVGGTYEDVTYTTGISVPYMLTGGKASNIYVANNSAWGSKIVVDQLSSSPFTGAIGVTYEISGPLSYGRVSDPIVTASGDVDLYSVMYKHIFVDNLMYNTTSYYDFGTTGSRREYGITDVSNQVYVANDESGAEFTNLQYKYLDQGYSPLYGKKYIDVQSNQALSVEFFFVFFENFNSEGNRMTVFSSNGSIIKKQSYGAFKTYNYLKFSIIMRDITFDGNNTEFNSPIIEVNTTNLYLQTNFVLANFKSNSSNVPMIKSTSDDSKIYLQGASIINNYTGYTVSQFSGCGIQLKGNLFISGALMAGNNYAIYMSESNATATMNGGMIVGNHPLGSQGGAISIANATSKVIVNSGIISYNHSNESTSAIEPGYYGSVELNGGLINHNKTLDKKIGNYGALLANTKLTIKGWVTVTDNILVDKEYNIRVTNNASKGANINGSLYGEIGFFVPSSSSTYFPQYLFANTSTYNATTEDINYLSFDQTGHDLIIAMKKNNDGIKVVYPSPIVSNLQQPTSAFVVGENINSKISKPMIQYYDQNNIRSQGWKVKKDVAGAVYTDFYGSDLLHMGYDNATLKYTLMYQDGVESDMLVETNTIQLSVKKATPVLKLEITPTMSNEYIEKLTLKPVLQGGFSLSGNIVQLKVDGLDQDAKLESGTMIDFTPAERDKEYTFLATYEGDANNSGATSVEYKFTFNKKIQDFLALSSPQKVRVGDPYSINVNGGSTSGDMSYQLIHGTTGEATIENNILTITRAGEIQFSVTKEGNSIYNPITQLFTIEAIDKKVSDITFTKAEKTVPYCGENIGFSDADVAVTGTDGALSYKYYTNDSGTLTSTSDSSGATKAGGAPKNAGTYYVKASVAGNEEYSSTTTANYAKLVIDKVILTPTIKTIASKDYDGNKNATGTLHFTGAVKNEQPVASATFEWDSKNALTTNVSVTDIALTAPWQQNYRLSSTSLNSQIAPNGSMINKKDVTVSVVVKNKQYDGLNTAEFKYPPSLNGVIQGENVTLVNGMPTFYDIQVANDIAIHLTDFSIIGSDKDNYDLKQPSGIKANITNTYNPIIDVDYTMPISEWFNEDVVISAKDGYQLSYTNTADGDWSDTLRLTTETSDDIVEFYVKNKTTKAISNKIEKNYKIDKTAPQGIIKVGGFAWNQLLHTITFGLFFKETQQVNIESTDNLSGISKVEYYESETQMTLEELKNATWISGNHVSITPEDKKEFIYYVRITDVAGNITYISSNGMVFDTTAPIIKNLDSETVYYIDQPFEIEETNLKSVSVNGTIVSYPYTLPGNINETYTIIASDKAGNQTSLTITMKTIQELGNVLDNITIDNVNSTHVEGLEKLMEKIDQYLSEQSLSEGDKVDLNNLKRTVRGLLDKANEVANAFQPDSYKDVAEITKDNVQLSSKNTLEQAKTELSQALEGYSNHYTDVEKQVIQSRINIIEDSLNIIRAANNVKQQIDRLPSQSNTTLQDGQKIIKLYDDYFLLTDHAKSLIVNKDKLKLLEVARSYAELNLNDDNTNTVIKAIKGTYFNPRLALLVEKVEPTKEKVESVKKVSQGSSIVSLYNINLLLHEEKVQPKGRIKVKLKLTKEQIQKYTHYQVVYIDDNNTAIIIPHVQEGDYVTFEADYLSQCGLIGKEKIVIKDAQDTEGSKVEKDNKTTSNNVISNKMTSNNATSNSTISNEITSNEITSNNTPSNETKTEGDSPKIISIVLLVMLVSIIIFSKKKKIH